jgi:hypothetical protein
MDGRAACLNLKWRSAAGNHGWKGKGGGKGAATAMSEMVVAGLTAKSKRQKQ